MSALAIAAICGVLYSPPAEWDDVPLPASARVVEVAFADLGKLCPPSGAETTQVSRTSQVTEAHFTYGCTDDAFTVAYVPTWETWPGTRACWLEVVRHEQDHLKGWRHPASPQRAPAFIRRIKD